MEQSGTEEPQAAKGVASFRSRLFAPTAASKARQASTPSPEPGGFIDLSKSNADLAGPPLFEPKAPKPHPVSPNSKKWRAKLPENGSFVNGHANGEEEDVGIHDVTAVKTIGQRAVTPVRRELRKTAAGNSNVGPGLSEKVVDKFPVHPILVVEKSESSVNTKTAKSRNISSSPAKPRRQSTDATSPRSSAPRSRSLERGAGRTGVRTPPQKGRSASPSPRPVSRPASPGGWSSSPRFSSLARRNEASPRSVLTSAVKPSAPSAWGLYSSKSQVLESTRKALGVENEGSVSSSSSSESGSGVNRRWSTGSRKMVPGLGAPKAEPALGRHNSVNSFALPADLKIGPDLKLDLKGKRLRKLSAATLSAKYEWVSWKENKLQSLDGIDVLKRIKFLNLSSNDLKSLSLSALAPLQTLQQLLLSANQLTTLATLPELPSLTFLSVSQNEITSLEMPPLPCLHTLIASKNDIASLVELPHMPSLQVLKVDDNPVLDDPLSRTVAMLLVGKGLKRFNDEAVEPADHFEALMYPPHMGACIRRGFVLTPENNTPEHLESALLQVHGTAGLPPGYAIASAKVERPSEGSPCSCHFEFSYTGPEARRAPLQKCFQWLRGSRHDVSYDVIPGATSESYVPGPRDVGQCLRVECTPMLGGIAFPPFFAVSCEVSQVLPPSVTRISIEGKVTCGETLVGSYEYAGGKEGTSQVAWFVHQDEADPGTLIQGSIDQRSRQLSRKEVGTWVSFRCTPKRSDGVEGQTQGAMSSERVKPVPLKLSKLSLSGAQMEGEVLTAQHEIPDEPEHREAWGNFFQSMTYQWYRSESGSRSTFAPLKNATSAEHRLSIEDVGRTLRCKARAKDAFGLLSEPLQAFSGLIEPAPPSVASIRLEGKAESGQVLKGSGDFRGGKEGASRFEWFRQDYTDGALYPLLVPNNAPEYMIPESEVGRRIVFKYTPVSADGKVGEPVFASSPIIELAGPKVSGLAIVGSFVEGSRIALLGKYSGGGKEGQSEVQWFKSKDGQTDLQELLQFENKKDFALPPDVVDHYLLARYTPIRIDGERGEPSFITSKTSVKSLPPSVVSIDLEGEMQAGATIRANYKYVGGMEGVSHYGWYLHDSPSGPGTPIPGSVGLKQRLLTEKEVGKFLGFTVTPLRSDGAEGATKSFISKEPIMQEPLELRSLTISGEPVEGESLMAVPTLPARGEWDKARQKFQYQWYRTSATGSSEFAPLQGETSGSYTASFEDVGQRIKCECKVADHSDRWSRSVAAITPPIEATPPCIRHIALEGQPMAGATLRGVASYFGGKQGASKSEWLRENTRTGEFEPIDVPNNALEYTPGNDDVGRRIVFKYTPINSYGKAGETVTMTSEPVKPPPPRVVDLSIRGEVVEGATVMVHAFYVGGGKEGLSRIQWFKSRSPSTGCDDMLEIGPVQTKRDILIPAGAVGWHLVASYVPVRSDGESGQPVQVVSAKPVAGLPPKVTSVQLSGAFVEGETLRASYEYAGGVEGSSIYGWYLHENERDPGTLIPNSVGLKEHLLTRRDVSKLVSFKCTPRREEGLEGPPRSAMSPQRIAPAPPSCKNVRIEGAPIEQGVLRAEKEYLGGYEGASTYQWYVTQPGKAQKSIEGATSSTYKLRPEDVGCMISVACTPVRIDGVNGDPQWASPVGPVTGGGRPVGGHVEIVGQTIEGESLAAQVGNEAGETGAGSFAWHRIDSSGAAMEAGKEETITLGVEDIGCRMRVTYVASKTDGAAVEEMTATSDVVSEGEPIGVSLELPPLQEGEEVSLVYKYFGGQEGSSEWGWYRSHEDPQTSGGVSADEMSMELMKVGSTRAYKPTVNDVEHWLLVRWTPVRRDGKRGIPRTASSAGPVGPAPPEVVSVSVAQTGRYTLEGSGIYRGGKEGASQYSWQRQLADGTRELILGASEKEYTVLDADFGHGLIFGYIPVRSDGVSGAEKVSQPAPPILPPPLVAGHVLLRGRAEEREILGAVVEGPSEHRAAQLYDRFKKEVQYKWFRVELDGNKTLLRTSTINGMYKARFEDVGRCLECECTVIDVWGRPSPLLSVTSEVVEPGLPLVERLRVYGREVHSGRFLVKGNYSGGVEGASTFQWYRAVAGSWQLTPIQGATGQKYEANVDDIGFILAAKYTPVRQDGTIGEPVTAQTTPVAIDADVARDVTQIVDQQAHKFDVMMATPEGLQKRTVDVGSKRLKINRTGTKTGRSVTEVKAVFKPPFWVEISLSDPYKAVLVLENDKMVEVVLPTRHERDVFAMALRKFAQKFR